MSNINEENKDLIENLVPWGLLDEETQSRLLGWKHGWEVWCKHAKHNGDNNWKWLTTNIGCGHFEKAIYYKVYRAKPAREWFVNLYPKGAYVYEHLPAAKAGSFGVDILSRWKITSDEYGSNPTIEVIDKNSTDERE